MTTKKQAYLKNAVASSGFFVILIVHLLLNYGVRPRFVILVLFIQLLFVIYAFKKGAIRLGLNDLTKVIMMLVLGLGFIWVISSHHSNRFLIEIKYYLVNFLSK